MIEVTSFRLPAAFAPRIDAEACATTVADGLSTNTGGGKNEGGLIERRETSRDDGAATVSWGAGGVQSGKPCGIGVTFSLRKSLGATFMLERRLLAGRISGRSV